MFITILLVLGVLSAIIGTIFSYKSAKGLELGKKLQQIALGQEKADYVLKQGDYVIINDPFPAANPHFLAIPVREIRDVNRLTPDDIPLLNELMKGIRTVLAEKNIEESSCVVGFTQPPFNTAFHLHMHCMSKTLTCEGARKWVYENFFISLPEVIENLQKKDKKE